MAKSAALNFQVCPAKARGFDNEDPTLEADLFKGQSKVKQVSVLKF